MYSCYLVDYSREESVNVDEWETVGKNIFSVQIETAKIESIIKTWILSNQACMEKEVY